MATTTYIRLLSISMAISLIQGVTIPPKIIKQGPPDIFFKVGETVKMECEASGEPLPAYTWRRAEIPFSPEGNDDRVVIQKGIGTIIINSPEDKDEGLYQCFATNSFGTAATIKFNLRMAKLEEFSTQQPIYHTPVLGDHLKLTCQSPDSVPDGHVTWVVNEGGFLKPVMWDSRVTVDYDDCLHFTYVTAADAMNGNPYQCMVSNPVMRMSVRGPLQYIQPQGSVELTSRMKKVWPNSRFDEQGLVGSDFKMKCIFSGNPTPTVRWTKKDSDKFNDRVLLGNSGGQELVIRDLSFDDAGTYLCDGTKEHEASSLEMSINLNINSRPYWVAKPKDVTLAEKGTAEFNCVAGGLPQVAIFWFVNGARLEDALKTDPRLDGRFQHLRDNKIVFQNVNQDDAMVFQCNVTNVHGYIWAEAILNVLSEAPTILERPSAVRVAEGHPFEIPCRINGKPDPIITWFREETPITGGRYVIQESGNLFVQKAVLSDAGQYRCHVKNYLGEDEGSGSLTVRRKTLLEVKPMDVEVQSGVNAKFTCSGTTDPEEISNMVIYWMKDHNPVQLGTRMFLNKQDNSLAISGTEQRDTGTYTCVISNGLDNDTASARLVVTDVPFPPTQVMVNNSCSSGFAEVTWMTGSFNNAPIQYFIIEYITTIDPNHWVFAAQVYYTEAMANITLSTGLTYFFRVTSYNKIGASNPSEPSTTSCTTSPDKPTQNPRNLRTIGDIPGTLHVEWTPVPPEHQGGPGCGYLLTIMKVGESRPSEVSVSLGDWRIYEYVHNSTGIPYQRYQITIKAINPSGNSNESAPSIIGYSYEGIPQISPYDLKALDVSSDTLTLQWKFDSAEIGKVDSKIRGQFMGFKIQFWEQGLRGETIRDVDVRPGDLSPQGDTYNVTFRHLIPNTRLEARVALLNNFYVSAPSESVTFTTPPGLPGPIQYMKEVNIADNHINLEWRPPLDNRGDLIGYDIGYQEVIKGLRLGELQERIPQIDDAFATTAMLSGLLPDTKYRIHVWARTTAGRGEGFYIERTTARSGMPSIPRFSIAGVGPNYINVTWWRDPLLSSGSIIIVEFRKQDGGEWLSTSPDVSKDWAKLSLLQPGINYLVRIVVVTGDLRRISEEEEVRTSGTAKAYDIIANLGWLLAMITSILLHIGLLIGFVICYRRGFRFKTQVKENKVETYREGEETYSGTHYKGVELTPTSHEKNFEPIGHVNQIYEHRQGYYSDESDGDNDYYNRPNPHDPHDGSDKGDYYDQDSVDDKKIGMDDSQHDSMPSDHQYEDYDLRGEPDHSPYQAEDYHHDDLESSMDSRGHHREPYAPGRQKDTRKPRKSEKDPAHNVHLHTSQQHQDDAEDRYFDLEHPPAGRRYSDLEEHPVLEDPRERHEYESYTARRSRDARQPRAARVQRVVRQERISDDDDDHHPVGGPSQGGQPRRDPGVPVSEQGSAYTASTTV
ncbi:unnamed protein product [Lymnaea stagnalis]|uniref:Uncharacterized protein n=1 Tax=Lymnaea stagnalis TaxID=6523 RepID=A0AAV2HFE7_LYMST